MRLLALAGIAALLAGCSLNYVDTSFTAAPKPQHMAEGEHHESNDEKTKLGETGPEKEPTAASTDASNDSTPPSTTEGGKEGVTARTSNVFPTTAPPSGR